MKAKTSNECILLFHNVSTQTVKLSFNMSLEAKSLTLCQPIPQANNERVNIKYVHLRFGWC